MGTLKDQPKRISPYINNIDLQEIFKTCKELGTKNGISIDSAIEIYKTALLEQNNNLYFDNGQRFDEQIAGIGKLLEEIIIILNSKNEI